MSNLHNERFDEIKSLIKKSKMLLEQSQINVAQDIEDRLQNDEDEFNQEYDTYNNPTGKEKSKKDKSQKYRISGGILSLHGKNRDQLDITSDEKIAFQETMDEFVEEVSDLVDFNTLNVYPNNVEWSGKLIDEDLEFIFTIGEDSGIYINGEMIKVDPEFMDTLIKLQKYYQKFKSKWGKVLASRKKTKELPD
jgi:hypothetical protein